MDTPDENAGESKASANGEDDIDSEAARRKKREHPFPALFHSSFFFLM